ncbi:MAG: TonB-dependent hemoglobin/transferrin/lactoferrin family receptor, partial [Cyanobacteria bacterium J06600_6]
MKTNKLSFYVIKLGAILSLTAIAPAMAESVTPIDNSLPTATKNLLVQNNIAEVTRIEVQETDGKLEVILKTVTGQKLVPLMMPDGNNLVLEIPDAILALPEGEPWSKLNPLPGITRVTAQQLDETMIRIAIAGEKATPTAKVVPTSQDLTLSITPEVVAQTNFEIDEETRINITVTGTRTPRPLLDSAGSISIIDSAQIDRQLIRDIGDLTRYEPGVSVGRSPNRFGNQDFNIRGIDGNRVLLQVDGVRIPDNYVGRGRDFFDLETIKRVEIIKGPASALYGSDAIGGVVSFITKDPDDYLTIFDNSLYTSVKTTYDSSDESISATGVIAAEDEAGKVQTSFVFSTFNGEEFKNGGTARPNPQDVQDNTLTGKVVYNFNDEHSIKLTGELFNSSTNTDVLSERGSTPFDVSNPPFFVFFEREEVEAEDTRERRRLSLNYDFDNSNSGWLEAAKVNFYYQDAQIEEDKLSTGVQQNISPAAPPTFTPIIRDEVNSFEQDVLGGDVQLQSDFKTGKIKHRLVYGFEVFNTDTSRPRDNTLINLTDGSINKFVVGEEFPNKTFPDTSTLRAAIFIQDEIELGKISLIPGIRWDYYSLNADEDEDFARINVDNFEVEDIDESAFSPKIGVVYKPIEDLSLYAQYARGFRSPPYDDANIGFTNFAFGYTVLPNADLEPETSDSFEVGLRSELPRLNFSLAGFYNDYDNFIDTVRVGTRTDDGFSQFQSQNIEQAEIYGVEAKAEYFFSSKQSGLSVLGSIAWAEGNNTSDDDSVPLNSVNPLEGILSLRYRAPENRWGLELIGTFVGEKTRIDNENISAFGGQGGDAELFAPDGYFTLDWLNYYNVSK